ncbi:MAG: stalk domain-containing protein, partial [Caldisericia bacterium]
DIEIPIKIKLKLVTPKIYILQKKIDLGNIYKGDKKEITIYIKNIGGSELEITKILSNSYWLEIPNINNLKGNDLEIKIIVNTENLDVNKSYNGKIIIRSNGGDEEVEINLYCIENVPLLNIDKNFIGFGEIKKGDEVINFFVLSNIGGGILSGAIKVSDSWIIVDRTSFSGNEFKIFVKIDSSKLNEGESYKGRIDIISNGGNKNIDIYVKIKKIEKTVITMQIGNKIITVNGILQEIDVPPQIIEGRTYLPIRWIAEPLGAQVNWDRDEKKVTILFNEIKIELW